jgi:carboxypeptidase T
MPFRLRTAALLPGLFAVCSAAAQGPDVRSPLPTPDAARFDRARIHGVGPLDLAALGIAVDHGLRGEGWVENVFPAADLDRLRALGYLVEPVVEDVAAFSAARAAAFDATLRQGIWPSAEGQPAARGAGPADFTQPADFTPGAMGGFYTLDEVYAKLDSLHARHPEFVSARMPVGGRLTHEGRTQFMVKISDQVDTDEPDEPNVLYTALLHAREPAGMMSVVFYMQWLMENYGSDPRATYVVDRCQLWFVPVANPDGYETNRLSNPGGGGMWRKNKRANPGGSTGVDLNRNWPYAWGYDNLGSSGAGASDVFRGPAPGSEPEVANLMDLAVARNFRTALNYHSFGELLIFPFGYDTVLTPDHGLFVQASNRLVADNGYSKGTALQTVGYFANGSSDDWFYGEQGSKDKTFAWTPEVGTWFWPSPVSILPVAQENALANLLLALLATRYDAVVPAIAPGPGPDHAATERHAQGQPALGAPVPNPIRERFRLPVRWTGEGTARLEWRDAHGRLLHAMAVPSRPGATLVEGPAADWPAGVVVARLVDAQGRPLAPAVRGLVAR